MTKEWIPVTSGLRKLPASSGRSLDPPPDFHSPRFFFHSHCCQVTFLLFCINCLKSLHILSSYPHLFTLLTPCPPYTQVDLGVNKTFLNGKSHSPCFSPFCLISHVNHTFKTPFSLDFCKASLSHFLSLLWPTSHFHSPPSLLPTFFHECDVIENFIFYLGSV